VDLVLKAAQGEVGVTGGRIAGLTATVFDPDLDPDDCRVTAIVELPGTLRLGERAGQALCTPIRPFRGWCLRRRYRP